MKRTTTVSKLKVGDSFEFIPTPWYGVETILEITEHTARHIDWGYLPRALRFKTVKTFDLKCSAAVVNPPALHYGISSSTKVRIIC